MMNEPAPAWNDLVELMCAEPRPPFRAVVRHTDAATDRTPAVDERLTVLHDGDALWMIRNGEDMLMGNGGESVFYRSGSVEANRGFGHASFGNKVKSLFHGRLMAALPEARGEIIGTSTVAERACWAARVEGLKSNDPAVFDLSVDRETGFVLQMTRSDMPEMLWRVESITIGTASSPPPPRTPKCPRPFPRKPPPPPPGAPRPFVVSPSMTDEEIRRQLFGEEPEKK